MFVQLSKQRKDQLLDAMISAKPNDRFHWFLCFLSERKVSVMKNQEVKMSKKCRSGSANLATQDPLPQIEFAVAWLTVWAPVKFHNVEQTRNHKFQNICKLETANR